MKPAEEFPVSGETLGKQPEPETENHPAERSLGSLIGAIQRMATERAFEIAPGAINETAQTPEDLEKLLKVLAATTKLSSDLKALDGPPPPPQTQAQAELTLRSLIEGDEEP